MSDTPLKEIVARPPLPSWHELLGLPDGATPFDPAEQFRRGFIYGFDNDDWADTFNDEENRDDV